MGQAIVFVVDRPADIGPKVLAPVSVKLIAFIHLVITVDLAKRKDNECKHPMPR